MTGFPERPSRPVFGPEMRNKRTPVNVETDLTADQMNLDFWQMSGAGRTLPMAVLLYDGAADSLLFVAAAFDPNQELATPIVAAKTGTGIYTFTFAATYPNERGESKSFIPRMAMTMLQGGPTDSKATVETPNGQVMEVNVRDSGDLVEDGTIVLAVW